MKKYSKGSQNIITDEYQVIRLSEGCPWKCPWCREHKEIGDNWRVFPIPEIIPIGWLHDDIKKFRASVRKHNQIVNFGIDPEL